MMKAKLHWVSWASVCILGAVVGCADAADDSPDDGVGGMSVTPPPGNGGGMPGGGGGQAGAPVTPPMGGTGGSPAGGTGNTPPTGGTGDTPSGMPPVSYAESVEPIILANCVTACHLDGGNGGPNGFTADSALDLSQGVGYGALTTGTSLQTGTPFVGPTPDESYLWLKLNPGPPSGLSMPFGTVLPEAQREIIRSWIESGAAP